MNRKPLEGQLTLNLFKQHERPSPTWDDVQKGRAELVDIIEPCVHDACMFWIRGRCTHTADNYAFPKKRDNGMCLQHFIIWKD